MIRITAQMVKELRDKTGSGFMECKTALKKVNGSLEDAERFLREKGILNAEKKASRITKQGRIGSYIHGEGRIGVLVELNCETDFVARTEEFKHLLKEISMQIAAMSPYYVSREEISQEEIDKEREIYRVEAVNSGRPEKIIDKIVEGKLGKYFAEYCLLDQTYARDTSMTISDLIKSHIAKLGENIIVKRFSRYVLGE